MIKSTINYKLSKCENCLKCMKICPSEAITILDNRVRIDDNKCINCGKCIDECSYQGLETKSSTIDEIQNYEYTVACVPSAVYSSCRNELEVEELTQAVLQLGFDEVFEMSGIEASIVDKISVECAKNNEVGVISSFCPVINRLIETKYPMLLDQLINMDYPSEIAARYIRKKHKNKSNLGIFYFCECVSKLLLAKYPYMNMDCEVDHALSLEDVFVKINQNRQLQKTGKKLSALGLKSCSMLCDFDENDKVLQVDDYEKVIKVLELVEFSQLQRFKYFSCSYCTNGCIGGTLLWGNPFDAKMNIEELIKISSDYTLKIDDFDTSFKKNAIEEDSISLQEKLKYFKEVNEIASVLPQFDCGACGFVSCRQMAEQIVLKNKKLTDCRIFEYRGREQ